MKAGDTSPPFRGKALDGANKLVDLTGASAKFRMRPQIAGLRAEIVADAQIDEAESVLTYDWAPEDSAVPGAYWAEFEATLPNGQTETFPNDEMAVVEILPVTSGLAVAPGPGPSPAPPAVPRNLTRFYGPAASVLSADVWTTILLNSAAPYQPVGDPYFEPVVGGPDDGGVVCLADGVYALTGGVVFDPAQQMGQRAVWVTSTATDIWNLANASPPFKGQPLPITVSGEAWIMAGEVVTLRAFSDAAAQTMSDPHSEFLSVVRLG
jgi:membrane-associated protease RseP (regulator of RpoE activity)